MKRILVALDKSSISKCAFDEAVMLAKGMGAELRLFHALTHSEPGSPQMTYIYNGSYDPHLAELLRKDYERDWNEFISQYLDLLKWRVEDAQAVGVTATLRQQYGTPGRAICEAAADWQADLIVMGSHGRTGLQEMWLGSVSNYVTHHAPCSVWLIHPKLHERAKTSPEKAVESTTEVVAASAA
ncbi:MAG: universal stress protein [Cyanobacteria bacterium J06635_1]